MWRPDGWAQTRIGVLTPHADVWPEAEFGWRFVVKKLAIFMTVLMVLNLSPVQAQIAGRFMTVFIRTGGGLMKVMIEKKTDLTIAVLGGVIIEVGKGLLGVGETKANEPYSPLVPPEGLQKNPTYNLNFNITNSGCSSLSAAVTTCNSVVNLPEEKQFRQLGSEELKQVQIDLQGSFLEPKTDFKAITGQQPNLGLQKDVLLNNFDFSDRSLTSEPLDFQKMKETAFWWSIQNSNYAADFQNYLDQFPNGEYRDLARQKMNQLSTPAPTNNYEYCGDDPRKFGEAIIFTYNAQNLKNMSTYVDQWFGDAIYRNRENSFRKLMSQHFQEMASFFQQALSISMKIDDWTYTKINGVVVVRVWYSQDVFWLNGQRTAQHGFESYTLDCSEDHRWIIWENVQN